jgi:8-oxo-dGTP diphosphatase
MSQLSVQPGAPVKAIVVCAGVIERDGRFLVTRRQKGVHLEGYWEFPGGKCDPGEPLAACLARELREELAIEAHVGRELLTVTHVYEERSVELHFLRCDVFGDPSPQLGQQMAWAGRDELKRLSFPPADAELLRILTNAEEPVQ